MYVLARVVWATQKVVHVAAERLVDGAVLNRGGDTLMLGATADGGQDRPKARPVGSRLTVMSRPPLRWVRLDG